MGNLLTDYKVEPLDNFCIVERKKVEDRTESGLYTVSKGPTISHQAKVLAAGPGRRAADGTLIENTVKVGDTVLLDSIAGFAIEDGDKKLTVVRETEIIAVIRNKDD